MTINQGFSKNNKQCLTTFWWHQANQQILRVWSSIQRFHQNELWVIDLAPTNQLHLPPCWKSTGEWSGSATTGWIDTQMTNTSWMETRNEYTMNAYIRHLTHLASDIWGRLLTHLSQTSGLSHLGSGLEASCSSILVRAGQPFGPGALNWDGPSLGPPLLKISTSKNANCRQ